MKNPELALAKAAKAQGVKRSVFVAKRTENLDRVAKRDKWKRSEVAMVLVQITEAAERVWPAKPVPVVQSAKAPAKPKAHPFQAAFDAWVQRKTPINALCKEFGVHSGHTLRKAFIEIAGSREAYEALKSKGAGGSDKPFAGKRPAPKEERVQAQTERDADVKALRTMRASKGWQHYHVWEPKIVTVRTDDGNANMMSRERLYTVFVSPKGREYTHALPNEPADLLHVGVRDVLGLPPVRLVRVEKSVVVKQSERARQRAEKIRAAREDAK
jgi:hypothetical protein